MTGEADDPRRAAWRVLRDVAAGAFADRAAERRFGALAGRDRALATELAYGVVRLRARLDHELAAFSDLPLDRVEGGVLDWLRLGLYQLRETRVPGHAAVDEAVEGARATCGARATGFVNGVLRAAARHEDRRSLFPSAEDDPVGHLSTWGSHPVWLVERWIDRWGRETAAELVEADNRPPPVTVRLPPDAEGAADPIGEGDGWRLDPLEGWPRCAVLAEGRPEDLLRSLPAAVVQDPAASTVVDYVGDPVGGPVLDACAAPGGKSVALAVERRAARPFVAGDVRLERLRRVRRASERAGAGVRCVVMDGRRPPVASASTVLLDVPCSGTGTLRRRPDARWRIGPDRLRTLVSLQGGLLDGCAEVVRPGGTMVYATCSLEAEENEEQVEAFLGRRPDFERDPAPEAVRDDLVDERGDLRILPWLHGVDGAYAARLRRSGP